MEQIDLVGLIANLGFPIVITFYLLLRLEKKIIELNEAINSLKDEIKNNK